MSNQPGVYWRFGQTGAEELKSKLASLHSEFDKGQIGLKQYAQGKREVSRDSRALTNEITVETNVFKANHPAILQATQAMSIFGSVANTVLSVTNAINLATLTAANQQDQLSDINIKIAETENELARMRKAGLKDTGEYQTAETKLGELRNQLANKQREFAQQAFQNGLTQSAAVILVASSVINAVPKTIALFGQLSTALSGVQFSVIMGQWMGSIIGFSVGVLLPLAVAVAAFYGTYELIRLLNPKYDKSMKELEGIIMNNWHADAITAHLVAPFVGAYLGFATLEDKITEQLYNFINTIINSLNTVPDTVNHAFGRIVIPRIGNLLPPGFANNGQNSFYNQAIRDLSLSSGDSKSLQVQQDIKKSTDDLVEIWTSVSNPVLQNQNKSMKDMVTSITSSTNPLLASSNKSTNDLTNAVNSATNPALRQTNQSVKDLINSIVSSTNPILQQQYQSAKDLINSIKSSTNPLLQQQNQSAKDLITSINSATNPILTDVKTGVSDSNSILDDLNSSVIDLNNNNKEQRDLAKVQLDAINAQKALLDTFKASLLANNDKIIALQKLPQSEVYSSHSDPDTGALFYDATRPTDAANKIQQLQYENSILAAKIGSSSLGGLDNATVGLGPILSALGLDANSGIGSIVSGALGGAAGIGGAGINASQIAEFVRTHDYGVFTSAAINDFKTQSATPTQQQQIDAWKRATGITNDDAARRALGYSGGSSSGSQNIGNGKFLGLPGQYGNPIHAAVGYDGIVSGPTMFLAGERGAEHVSITPGGRRGGNGDIYVTVNAGTVIAERDLMKRIKDELKSDLKGAGFIR